MTKLTPHPESYPLLFDVRRSVRYHDKRGTFFLRLHKWCNFLAVLMAGSVLFDLARPGDTPAWLLALSVAAALCSVVDIVVGFANVANVHDNLKRSFCNLELDILAQPGELVAHHATRLKIEMSEPGIYKALDALCHNELLLAQGFKPTERDERFAKITWWQRASCQFWSWSHIGP